MEKQKTFDRIIYNPLQLNPWDWYSNKGTAGIPPPNNEICSIHNNSKSCPCLNLKTTYTTDKNCWTQDYCQLEKYGNNIDSPLSIPAGLDTNGFDQPWFDPWIRSKME